VIAEAEAAALSCGTHAATLYLLLRQMPYIDTSEGATLNLSALCRAWEGITGKPVNRGTIRRDLEHLQAAGAIRVTANEKGRRRIALRGVRRYGVVCDWSDSEGGSAAATFEHDEVARQEPPLNMTEGGSTGATFEHAQGEGGSTGATKWLDRSHQVARQEPPLNQPTSTRSNPLRDPREGAREAPKKKTTKSKPRKKRWRFAPSSWTPTERHRELAASLGVDLDAQAEMFRCHEFSTPKSDADRAFSNWLRRSADYGSNRRGEGLPQPNSGYDFSRFRN